MRKKNNPYKIRFKSGAGDEGNTNTLSVTSFCLLAKLATPPQRPSASGFRFPIATQ